MKPSAELATVKSFVSGSCGKSLVCACVLAAGIASGPALANAEDTNPQGMGANIASDLQSNHGNDASPVDNQNELHANIDGDTYIDNNDLQEPINQSSDSDGLISDTIVGANLSANSDANNQSSTEDLMDGCRGSDGATTETKKSAVTETDPPDGSSAKESKATSESTGNEQKQKLDEKTDIETYAINGMTFTDVASDAWYAPYVRWASNQGLVSGYKDVNGNLTGCFGPEDNLTRAELATILWRNAGCPSAQSAGFSDTNQHWAEQAIDWCASQGIVTGYSGTDLFGPDDQITREQLCTMLWRMEGRPSDSISPSRWHDGGSVDTYAWDAVAWAAGRGIMAGTASAPVSLNPLSNATRGEAAKMLAVALGGYGGTSPEHQLLLSLTGLWQGASSGEYYYRIHDGEIDRYSRSWPGGGIGEYQGTQVLTESDIKWYNAGHFNNGRSDACYAFKAFGCWMLYDMSGDHINNWGSRGNSYYGGGTWMRVQ